MLLTGSDLQITYNIMIQAAEQLYRLAHAEGEDNKETKDYANHMVSIVADMKSAMEKEGFTFSGNLLC